LNDAIANVRSELVNKRLQLVLNLRASESIVLGDPVRLQQILWNIIKNAVKFTREEGKISVETVDTAKKLIIKVTDTGIGMTADEIGLAFKAFSQGEHAAAGSQMHRFGGLGLGLAISKMLVELHDGHIYATSPGRNQGATFVVELPLWRGPAVDNTSLRKTVGRRSNSLNPFGKPDSRNSSPLRQVRHRILLVEDHTPTRLTLQQLLKCRHYEVAAARSAAEACQLASTGKFALVISDVGLPDRTGYELLADLRTTLPTIAGIALSGYGMEEDLARSKAAGFSFHLVKPVTINVLEEAINHLLLPQPPNDSLSV